ncbi:hypothetical protein AB0395_16970 [Streptosporangium sp. NPDC051023]
MDRPGGRETAPPTLVTVPAAAQAVPPAHRRRRSASHLDLGIEPQTP